MKYISLFSGIGGMDLGLDRAGHTCVAQVEIDPFCRAVLAKHWPEVPKYDDVRTVGRHNLPDCDGIVGGFPCQDISDAGKRAGIDGARSGLWREFARIICEMGPRFVLVENVPALLERGMGRVLGDLAASGYDAEWGCIPAAAVGAPHRRDRLFVLAYPNGAYGSDTALSEPVGAVSQDFKWWRGRLDELGASDSVCRGDSYADVVRAFHGVPDRVDRLKGLGNAVVPQVAEWIGRHLPVD